MTKKDPEAISFQGNLSEFGQALLAGFDPEQKVPEQIIQAATKISNLLEPSISTAANKASPNLEQPDYSPDLIKQVLFNTFVSLSSINLDSHWNLTSESNRHVGLSAAEVRSIIKEMLAKPSTSILVYPPAECDLTDLDPVVLVNYQNLSLFIPLVRVESTFGGDDPDKVNITTFAIMKDDNILYFSTYFMDDNREPFVLPLVIGDRTRSHFSLTSDAQKAFGWKDINR